MKRIQILDTRNARRRERTLERKKKAETASAIGSPAEHSLQVTFLKSANQNKKSSVTASARCAFMYVD